MSSNPTQSSPTDSFEVQEETLAGLDAVQHALESQQAILSTPYGEEHFGIPSVERIPNATALESGEVYAESADGRAISWYEGSSMSRRGDVLWTVVYGDTELLAEWIGYDTEQVTARVRTVRHQLADMLYPSLENEQ